MNGISGSDPFFTVYTNEKKCAGLYQVQIKGSLSDGRSDIYYADAKFNLTVIDPCSSEMIVPMYKNMKYSYYRGGPTFTLEYG